MPFDSSSRLQRLRCLTGLAFFALSQVAPHSGALGQEATSLSVDFDQIIRPILSDKCYKCHGPDDDQRQAELRLDTPGGAIGGDVIVPGKAAQSELYRRIAATDDQQMPPASAKNRLTKAEIELLKRWIDQGAQWKEHWAFVPPVTPPLPQVQDNHWSRNQIDRFVLARLPGAGLAPHDSADRETLIRRVTLDLTGTPPTPEDVRAFLADPAPNAYERLVDRLLASPRYGEKMATNWLYAARYADTSGYQNDGPRYMWRWRDWVIEAYNHAMPFDQFTREQLAGDLLANPTLEQVMATGFNRNHRGNSEGGVIPEEFQVEYVVDRVETTATVWLGLTLGCARCHEHKFDPLTQEEFYRFYAFFNNIPENGRAIKEGNSPPLIKAPTRTQRESLAELKTELHKAEQEFASRQAERESAQSAWEDAISRHELLDWQFDEGLVAHFAMEEQQGQGTSPTEYQDGEQRLVKGRVGQAAQFDGKSFANAGDICNFGYFDRFSCSIWVYPQGSRGGTILSRMTDAHRADGYYLALEDGRVQVNLVKRWLDDCIRIESQQALPEGEWTHLVVTYDGSRVARGIKIFINGDPAAMTVNLDGINQTFASAEPLRIGGGGGPDGRFLGLLDEVRLYDRALTADEAAILTSVEPLSVLAAIPVAKRSSGQKKKLQLAFLSRFAPETIRNPYQNIIKLRRQLDQLIESFPTLMVMQEMAEARGTFVLERGQYDKPLERVEPGVPSVFPDFPDDAPTNRLGLAQWLLDPDHPLTARVAVNRYWQNYFGNGLVKTVEDFGSQGTRPSHPQLLDWLAREFVAQDWDTKAAQRRIVLSATYRQASHATEEERRLDPDNRFLGRGPRYRLPAEVVRDQALAASGLLDGRLGGPSVKPYQPADLWSDIATDNEYKQDHGADLYRRSMYIYWKRTVVPPTMSAFDATAREMCTVRPRRTNTPLQALTLMNELTYVEAARVLAQRVMQEADSVEARLGRAFQLVLARQPAQQEMETLKTGWQRHRDSFRQHPEAASSLASVGEFPTDPKLDAVELAAYAAITNTLLNLDETVTKQ